MRREPMEPLFYQIRDGNGAVGFGRMHQGPLTNGPGVLSNKTEESYVIRWVLVMLAGLSAMAAWGATSAPASSPSPSPAAGSAAETSAPQRYMITDDWDSAPSGRLKKQVQWLNTGSGRFAALALPPDKAGPPKGALIVADLGQSPDTAIVGLLRHRLTGSGWFTLSMALPQPPLAAPAPSTSSAAPAPAAKTASKTSAPSSSNGNGVTIDLANGNGGPSEGSGEDFMKQATSRVEAGVKYLQSAGYRELALIGVGHGADVLMHAVANGNENMTGAGVAYVWIRPVFTGPEASSMGKVLGKGFTTPILDLVDTEHPITGYRDRKGAMARAGIKGYSQQQLPLSGPFATLGGDELVARIRGWLKTQLGH